MKKARTIITFSIVMTVLLLSVFGLVGCSVGSLAPEVAISGAKFEIDDTKIDRLLQKGCTIVERGIPYPNDTKINARSITNELDLYKDGIKIDSIALKNDSFFGAENIGDCVAHHINLDYKVKENFPQDIYLEGVPLFTTKVEDLISKLEKKLGKGTIGIMHFKQEDLQKLELSGNLAGKKKLRECCLIYR